MNVLRKQTSLMLLLGASFGSIGDLDSQFGWHKAIHRFGVIALEVTVRASGWQDVFVDLYSPFTSWNFLKGLQRL